VNTPENGIEGKAQPSIHPNALVETPHVGVGTRVWAFAHLLPGAVVGRACNICDGVFIEGDATVGDRVTVKCGVQLWSGVTLEDDVFVGPNATFTNDLFPRSRQYPESFARTIVRRGASIGANATLLPGITIGERAMIGAGAVVTHVVPAGAIAVGNPARVVGTVDDRRGPGEKAPRALEQDVMGIRAINLPEIVDARGSLTFAQFDDHLPFIPRRYFTVMDVPSGARRGGHAHRTDQEFIVVLRGRVVIALDDGRRPQRYELDSPQRGLYVPPMVWIDLEEIAADAIILCLAAAEFRESDYIRDRHAFNAMLGSR
jgi:acetyltransferase-like isoleucine patch superfamily enzyme/dTDP-4-dehydrorhamnose 3,5-epimerase-like enzyme